MNAPPQMKTAACEAAVGELRESNENQIVAQNLAAEINAAHARAFGKAREALEHARRAGELLLQAKAAVGHGQWLPWLKTHCSSFSERTSQGYMRLAKHWDEIQAKSAT